jgi:hypothetical protein
MKILVDNMLHSGIISVIVVKDVYREYNIRLWHKERGRASQREHTRCACHEQFEPALALCPHPVSRALLGVEILLHSHARFDNG